MASENHYNALGAAALIGAGVALGKMLANGESITTRVAAGRAVCNAVLAMSGFAVLTFVPALGPEGQIGVAALMASLGTTGLELMAKKVLGPKAEVDK